MIPLRDDIPSERRPWITWGLILANVLVFSVELGLPERELARFFAEFGVVPARYADPSWGRGVGLSPLDPTPFLTSQFLHGGWLHLLFNMWTLWIFGDNVEDRMGPLRFLGFYLLCGLAAGGAHLAASPTSVLPVIGASGAIAGVLGAYLFLYPRARVLTLIPILFYPLFIELPALVFLLIWFATQFLQGTAALSAGGEAGGVAWWAHVGGFVFGLLAHRLFLARRRPRA